MSLISVITASYNSEKTIADTFKSVLNQSYRPVQYLVVDGASTDNTLQIIKEYEPLFRAKGIDFKWISEPDKGIYDAWNKGLEMADGEWIGFLGSDDVYHSDALEVLIGNGDFDDFDFLTARCRYVQGTKVLREFGEAWKWLVFRKEMKILHAGGLHNASYFKTYGIFDTSFKIAGDYEMLLRAGENLKVKFVDQVIVDMGSEGVSSSFVFQSLQEVLQAKTKNASRPRLSALVDLYWVYFKIKIKSLV